MTVGELRTWTLFLSKVPDPDRVIEAALARINANYVSAHIAPTASRPKPSDFMTNRDPWDVVAEDMSVFDSIAAAIHEGPQA